MPETLSKALLSRMLRSETLRRELADLHALSGMSVHFLDGLGNGKLSAPRQSTMNQPVVFSFPIGADLRRTLRQALLAGLEQGLPTSPSLAGWRELGFRMEMEGATIGFWVLSWFRQGPQSLEEAQQAWKEHAKQGGDWTWQRWRIAWESAPLLSPDQIQAWLRALAHASSRCLAELQELHAPRTPDGALPHAVREVCARVRDNPAAPHRLQDLAAQLHLSPEHLSRLFHHSTGLRFREYLAEMRLHHACERLTHTRDPIAKIATACGFPSLSRFHHAFRQHTGTTPAAWRRRG